MTRFAEINAGTQRRLEEAAEWHLNLRSDPSLELSPEYAAWFADGDNARALQAVEEGWSTVGDLAAAPEFLMLRRAALARAQRAGVKRWFPKRVAGRAAAAIVLACVGGGGAIYEYWFAPTTYETDIGERRVVALPDGSRISMDSNTEVEVRYSEIARTLELDHGRARFDVAHDVTRPFSVTAGGETVVAVGTSFNVERLGSRVLVTLIRGHVVVKGAGGVSATALVRKRSVSLDAGEQLVAKADATPVIAPANLQTANAWEAGHLVFKDEALGDVVERVNRYTNRPITVDPNIASIRISGVFNAGDLGAFVSAVTGYLPIQATTRSDNQIHLQSRS